MGHSVASASLMAGIFKYFRSLTKIFSNYIYDVHIWLTIYESTFGGTAKNWSQTLSTFFFPGSLRGSKMEHRRVAKSSWRGNAICATFFQRDIPSAGHPFERHFVCATFQLRGISVAR